MKFYPWLDFVAIPRFDLVAPPGSHWLAIGDDGALGAAYKQVEDCVASWVVNGHHPEPSPAAARNAIGRICFWAFPIAKLALHEGRSVEDAITEIQSIMFNIDAITERLES